MSARHLVPSAVALSILVALMASAIVDRAGGQALRGEYKVGVLEPLTGPLAVEGKRHLEQHYMRQWLQGQLNTVWPEEFSTIRAKWIPLGAWDQRN